MIPRALAHLVRLAAFAFLGSLRSEAAEAAASRTLTLFNGHNLQGWHSWLVDTGRADPRGVFTVTNGCLRISGEGLGYLATEREFADFRLEVDWRWGTRNSHWGDRLGRARDSGIFLHATGPDGNSHDGEGAFMAAIECNLFQGACGDLLLIRGSATDGSLIAPHLTAEVRAEKDPDGWYTWHRHGRRQTLERWGRLNARTKSMAWQDHLDFRGPRDRERRAGAWNHLVCEWRRDRLRIRLNGSLVNEAFDLSPARGRILLQCEGSEIFFRRVVLCEFPEPGSAPGASGPAGPGPQ